MLKWLMRRGTAAFERQWNYDAGYVHDLIEADPLAAWRFQRATSLGKYRKDVPIEALLDLLFKPSGRDVHVKCGLRSICNRV